VSKPKAYEPRQIDNKIDAKRSYVITKEMIDKIEKKRKDYWSSKEESIMEAWKHGITTMTFGDYVRDTLHYINGWWVPYDVSWEEFQLMYKQLGKPIAPRTKHHPVITCWYKYHDVAYMDNRFVEKK
jgi:hypothetical protein